MRATIRCFVACSRGTKACVIKRGAMHPLRLSLLSVATIATIATLGCGKGPEMPHGAPVLVEVLWELKGAPTLVWSRNADAAVATVVPPQGTRVDFVFDRRLDGARVEDTVGDM